MFSHGTNARIWLDGFAASAFFEDVNVTGKIDTAETTTITNTAKSYIPGLESSQIKMKGFFDTNSLNPTTTLTAFFEARRRTVYACVFAPEGGDTIGDPCALLQGFQTEYDIDSKVKDAVSTKVNYQSNTGLQYGKVLVPDAARTATDADGVGRLDNTASSANGAVAILAVSSVLGTTPTLAVKLQHSTDDSVWTDISGGGFTTANAASGVDAQYLVMTGTINRYVRAVWTVTGTTPSFTFNVAFYRR